MYISEAKSQNASKAAKKAPKKKRQTETWVHTSTFSFSSDIVTLDAAEMRGSGDNIVGAIVVGTYDGEIIVIDAGKIYVEMTSSISSFQVGEKALSSHTPWRSARGCEMLSSGAVCEQIGCSCRQLFGTNATLFTTGFDW